MPRLNFSIDDNYHVAPTAPAVPAVRFNLSQMPATTTPQRNRMLGPLFVKVALGTFVLGLAAILVATGAPIHFWH